MSLKQIEANLTPDQGKQKALKAGPYYSYDILPKGWIRLIQLVHRSDASLNNREAPLHVSMISVPIESCPNFVALSYTWGNPTFQVDAQTQVFSQEPRCYPIHCKRKILLGSRNLLDALRSIHFAQHSNLQHPDHHKWPLADGKIGDVYDAERYLWVDALCIDQDDERERSSQVAQMGAIFRKAGSCVAWLGESDHLTHFAMEFAVRIANDKAIRRHAKEGQDQSINKFSEMFTHELSLLSKDQAVALALFFSRKYFSRLWIVQEAVLVLDAVIMCGTVSIGLEGLIMLGRAFHATNTFSFWCFAHKYAEQRGLVIPSPGLGGSCSETQFLLEGIAICRSNLDQGKLPSFLTVLAMTAKAQATDPRDKIYGILSITNELMQNSEPLIRIDYNSPVEEVYISATVVVATQTNNLEFLFRVCERIHYKHRGLPSWCPDYSASDRPVLLSSGGANFGCHTGQMWSSPPLIVFAHRVLAVEGFQYDTIRDVAGGSHPANGIDSGHWGSGLLSLVANLEKSTTRVETLWRLLTFDILNFKRPAPNATGFILPALCAFIMAFSLTPRGGVAAHSEGSLGPVQNLVEEEMTAFDDAVQRLLQLEPQSAPFLPQRDTTTRTFASEINNAKWYYEELFSIQNRAKQAKLERELEDIVGSKASYISQISRLNPIEEFFDTQILSLFNTTLIASCTFSTERTERLGLGPKSLRLGDEIWYLHGASGPCILRPLESGHYEFAGMVYIHGLMYGEIANEPGNRRDAATRIYLE